MKVYITLASNEDGFLEQDSIRVFKSMDDAKEYVFVLIDYGYIDINVETQEI